MNLLDIRVLDTYENVLPAIKKIAAQNRQQKPFYICDVADIVEKHNTLCKLLPRVSTFYAVKCNDHPLVIDVLVALGVSFDCASKSEVRRILDLGVEPHKIIFANPAKLESHISYAREKRVSRMTFDTEAELRKIQRCYPEAETVLRIRYDDETSTCTFGEKFGCDYKQEAPLLLAKANELGIKVVGVSFHVGSPCNKPSIYYEAIKAAKFVFSVASDLGIKFTLLDIGGGFDKNTIKEVSLYVNRGIDEFFSDDESVEIISEPGRYYVASAFTLASKIHLVTYSKSSETYMYYLNVGVYNSLIGIAFGDKHHPKPLELNDGSQVYRSVVWGPTLDSCDKICDNILLPQMDIDDWVVFENTGAYTLNLGCTFNGFPLPEVYAVIDAQSWEQIKG